MSTLHEKVAESLGLMRSVQERGVVRAAAISRTHRERLIAAGFLRRVIKGWFMVSSPGAADRGSTEWYAGFWDFSAQYLRARFGNAYCLGPEASLKHHVESTLIPAQVVVITRKAGNQLVQLPFGTSLLMYQDIAKFPEEPVQRNGMWVMNLPEALVRVSPHFFQNEETDAQLALVLQRDSSPLLRVLLKGGSTVVANRLAGAYAHLGEGKISDDIVDMMRQAGHDVRPHDPFRHRASEQRDSAARREGSPAQQRIRTLWARMRPEVVSKFPSFPGLSFAPELYLAAMEERYSSDAYNSLSIEGYRVTPELIERVRQGNFDPAGNLSDDRQQAALAARGYFEAFRKVKEDLRRVLQGEPAAHLAKREHGRWYASLFAPAVAAGLLDPAHLAGYRNTPVFLKGSRHVPPRSEVVFDCMDTFFELLESEENPGVQAVLGHFFFVYIHPYPDGNGRVGRFLMNLLLSGGGYPWTVVRERRRERYLNVLEDASVRNEIGPFTEFLAEEMGQKDVDQ